MTRLFVLCFLITCSNQAVAYDNGDPVETYHESNEYDDAYDNGPDNKYAIELKAVVTNITTQRAATYEVTEIVNDIPSPSTKLGPVIPNYTTSRPLNHANVNIVKNSTAAAPISNNYESNGSIDEGDSEGKDNVKAKKNTFSIYHISAEYDDKPTVHLYSGDLDTIPHRPGFKEYLFGLKKGFVNGLNKIFNRHGHGIFHKYEREYFDNPNEDFDHTFRHNINNDYE